jgi:hypothetical protein
MINGDPQLDAAIQLIMSELPKGPAVPQVPPPSRSRAVVRGADAPQAP